MKRGTDLLIVLAATPVAAAAIGIAALAIKWNSSGPIFFFQTRMGKDGKPFEIIKLRTMRQNHFFPHTSYTAENDPRITSVGKILRRWKVDELPQLINVLRGQMSVVGPRPVSLAVFDTAAECVDGYALRLLAKPGLTGEAQIDCHGCIGSGTDYQRKFDYDVEYLRHRNLIYDFKLMLRTILHLVAGKPLGR